MARQHTEAIGLEAQQRLGDAVLTVALALYAAGAVVLGVWFDNPAMPWGAAVLWALGLSLPGLAGFLVWRGRLVARLLMATSLPALVALHIQLSAGMLEFHFGVFVTLALLLVYLDWRPVVWAAALFAVHHVAFDRLQAMGLGVYCLTTPNFPVILLHALYVVVQTALQVVLVHRLARSVRDNAEVALLAGRLQDGERIVLDSAALTVRAPLAVQLQQALGRMAAAVSQVRGSVESLQTASAEIAKGNQDLSTRTEQTASSLQQTAASLEQLTQTVQQSAETAQLARELANQAAVAASRGGAVVAQVVTTMGEIDQSSRRIGDIIGVIDGIAFQTNILALNAAVEAARAGEQGRGFAVVAGEVRSLAQRSAQAAKEIKDLILASEQRVRDGNAQVHEAGQAMDDIVASVGRVSERIGEISATAQAQSGSIAEVNGAVVQLDHMTQQNAALVEESAAATESLKDQAEQVLDAMAVFRLGAAAQAGLPRIGR